MASFNQVTLMGNLTRDPEEVNSRKATIAKFGLAVNSTRRDGDPTFVDITVFDKQAEFVMKYLEKGSQVLVSGRLQTESWEDKRSGKPRSKLSVIAGVVQAVGGKGKGGDDDDEDDRRSSRRSRRDDEDDDRRSSKRSRRDDDEDDGKGGGDEEDDRRGKKSKIDDDDVPY